MYVKTQQIQALIFQAIKRWTELVEVNSEVNICMHVLWACSVIMHTHFILVLLTAVALSNIKCAADAGWVETTRCSIRRITATDTNSCSLPNANGNCMLTSLYTVY